MKNASKFFLSLALLCSVQNVFASDKTVTIDLTTFDLTSDETETKFTQKLAEATTTLKKIQTVIEKQLIHDALARAHNNREFATTVGYKDFLLECKSLHSALTHAATTVQESVNRNLTVPISFEHYQISNFKDSQ